jgi:hypothetical protein
MVYFALSSGVSTVPSPPRNLTSCQDVPSSLLAESDEDDCAQAHVSSARNKGKSLVISSSYSKTSVHRATASRLLTSERTSQSFYSFVLLPEPTLIQSRLRSQHWIARGFAERDAVSPGWYKKIFDRIAAPTPRDYR